MSETNEATHGGYAMSYAPTKSERLWYALGYRYHLGEEPDDIDALEGWMCTVTRMQFSLADRLRLLLTGRLHIRLVQHLPVRCDFSRNRLDWEIRRPGTKWERA